MRSLFLARFRHPRFLFALFLAILIHGMVIVGVSSSLSGKPESKIAVLQAVLIPAVRKVEVPQPLPPLLVVPVQADVSPSSEPAPVPASIPPPSPSRPPPAEEIPAEGVVDQLEKPMGCLSAEEAAQRANDAAIAVEDLRIPCEVG